MLEELLEGYGSLRLYGPIGKWTIRSNTDFHYDLSNGKTLREAIIAAGKVGEE